MVDNMSRLLFTLFLVLMIGLIAACGSKVSGWAGSECYECADSASECVCPGYGGYYNPKALDLFRPGRWEMLDNPVW